MSSNGKIKVLVADDSGFMRLLISDIITGDEQIEVVATAENGKEAVEKTLLSKPDVVLLDMIMPQYDGVYAVEQIMKRCPTPIVILSSLGNTNIEPIMRSLELGAFDYLNKPDKGNSKLRDIDKEIIRKVRIAANSKAGKNFETKAVNNNNHAFSNVLPYDVIAIGSSTGGPQALEQLVTRLPGNLPLPVLIAQHMPVNFVPSFAERMNALVEQKVVVGRKGMPVKPGHIIIAPGDHNMIVRKDSTSGSVMIDYNLKIFKEFNNPSVNALFESVANVYGNRSMAAILTGMGKDGSNGMELIHKKGGFTIAQNQTTCAVYGMPREAVERNIVNSVVPITEMGGFITSCLS